MRKTKIPSKLTGELARTISRMSGRLWPRHPRQIAPIGGIADQRLVALLQLRIERGDDRFTVLAVVLGFRFVAADDIANAFGLHRLMNSCGFSRLALDEEGHERIVVLEHDLAHDGVFERSRCQRIYA